MINLYSDTQSMPTEAMRRAIASAEVGDEQKGMDPTVNALTRKVSELVGKQSALFLPSGTMCNVIAVATHCSPGDAVLAEADSHLVRYEGGHMGAVTGAMLEPIKGVHGKFTADQVFDAFTAGSLYTPRTRLLCVEQTCNLAGGTAWTADELADVGAAAKSLGIAAHMDGARLLNAVVSTGRPASEHCANFDSVWIDFTKGLGAPFGAVLCGSEDFIERARFWKHRLGGAMRQAGMMAAGCLYSLDHHVERLAEDHNNARRLNELLKRIHGVQVHHEIVDTNIVYFSLDAPESMTSLFLEKCIQKGLKLGAVGKGIRCVTYLDITSEHIDQAAKVVAEVSREMRLGARENAPASKETSNTH